MPPANETPRGPKKKPILLKKSGEKAQPALPPASSSTSVSSSGSSTQQKSREARLLAALGEKSNPTLPGGSSSQGQPDGRAATKTNPRPHFKPLLNAPPKPSTSQNPKPVVSSDVAKMQKELEDLKAYKARKEAEEAAAKKVPIERPTGECNRKQGKTKKNKKGIVKDRKTFTLAEKMKCRPAKVTEISKRLGQLQAAAGVPRGAYVSHPEWAGALAKWETLIGKDYSEFTDGTYVGNWPLRFMMIQKTEAQRKHDKASARKKAGGAANDEDEGEGGSQSPAGNDSVKLNEGEVLNAGDPDAGDEGDQTDGEDGTGLSNWRAWARLGPLLANFLIDVNMYNLDENWADYAPDAKDRESWQKRDEEIQKFLDGLPAERIGDGKEFGEPVMYKLIHERLGDGEDFDDVWRAVCLDRFGFDPLAEESDDEAFEYEREPSPGPSSSTKRKQDSGSNSKTQLRKKARRARVDDSDEFDASSVEEMDIKPRRPSTRGQESSMKT